MSEGIVGRRFPSVAGVALSGERVRFPEDVMGKPVLLLCAYRRLTQADVDLWAAHTAGTWPGLSVFELPIIPALVWRPLQGWIDGGMRGGVPRRQWSRVVTLYEQGGKVRDFLGDEGGHRAHAVLLDAAGVVVFHDAGGFRDAAAARLADAIARLGETD